jgi:hypothetical protein
MKCWQALNRIVETYWKLIQWSVVGLSFVLIGTTLYLNWGNLSSFDWHLNYLWFGVSLVLVSLVVPLLATWWTLNIRLLHEQLGWRQGARIWAFTQLAKYLPGGIWDYVSRVYASNRVGVSKSSATLSLAIEAVLRTQAAVIVFLLSLPFWPKTEWSHGELLVITSGLLAGFVVLHPFTLNRGMNLALRMLQKPPVSITSLKYRHILGLLGGHIATAAGAGGAFYLMVIAVYYVPLNAALPMAGMLAISVIAGFLNPLTPHGLGTREGLLALLLRCYLPLPAAIAISLLARLWLTLSDLVGLLIVTLTCRAVALIKKG